MNFEYIPLSGDSNFILDYSGATNDICT